MGFIDVLRVRRDGQHVEPQVAAFLGNGIGDVDALARFVGTRGGLEDIAGEAGGNADVAVGQVGHVFGGMEIADVWPHFEQLGFGLGVVVRVLAVGVEPKVIEHRRDHLVGRVEKGDAATGQLLRVLRLEYHRPGIDLLDTQRRGDALDVVADAIGAPQIGRGVSVAGIVLLQLLEQCRVEVVPVRQLAPVQLLEGPRLDLLAEEMVGRHHHVVAAAAGQQLAFEGLVRIEDVVDGLDAGLLLERFQCRLADVVRPVVDMYVGSLGANGSAGRGGDDERLQCRAHG